MRTLTRQEVKDYIRGTGECRPPYMIRYWTPVEYTGNCSPAALAEMEKFQDDVLIVFPELPAVGTSCLPGYPEYRWYAAHGVPQEGGIDNRPLIADWETDLEPFLAHLPDPTIPELLDRAKGRAAGDSRYRVGHFWNFYYERLWMMRGMENALTDLYFYPDQVRQLFQAFTDIYLVYVERLKRELDCDAIFITDDLGMQTGLMFSPEKFRELFRPYYQQVIDRTHQLGMDFWMHSCGNIEDLLGDLVDMGVQVVHPVQKFAMDQARVSRNFGDKICFMPGSDLQEVLPFGSREDIEADTERMFREFTENGKHFIFALGNMVTGDVGEEKILWQMDILRRKAEEYEKLHPFSGES